MKSKECHGVLVIEDDQQIREIIQEVLEFEGFTVVTAENGKDAIEILKKIENPCLILLDLMMPVMNGWEFLEHRKVDEILMTIPVAIVSAAENKNIKTAGQVQAVIKKPIDLALLMKWVNFYCGGSK